MRMACCFCVVMCVALAATERSRAELAPRDEFVRANTLYEQEHYAEALQVYERLLASGVANTQVLGNAGNAAYQTGDKGRAVLYYLRALKNDPRNDMARQNLTRVQPRTNAESDDDMLRVARLWLVTMPGWLWVALAEMAFFGGLAVLLIGTLRARSAGEATEWAVRAGGLLLIAAVAAGCGALAGSIGYGDGDAVVMVDGAVTRVGPGERYLEQLSLPAGTLVELPGAPADGWVRFRLKDGRTGFIRTETLEPV